MLEDEDPEETPFSDGKNFIFVFIVDRSGSMSGQRMATCVTALKFFMKSLPRGSKFSIISFGSSFDYMRIDGSNLIEYNDENSTKAI